MWKMTGYPPPPNMWVVVERETYPREAISLTMLDSVLKEIRSITGMLAAPHVASGLWTAARGDNTEAGRLALQLTQHQIAGMSVLPFPFPALGYGARFEEAAALSPARKRLLQVAAISTSDRVDVVLSAAGVDVAELLALTPTYLHVNRGRFRFTDERLRSFSSPADSAGLHRALAKALRDNGLPGQRAWHAALAQQGGEPRIAREILALSGSALSGGSPHAAFVTAGWVIEHGDHQQHASALLLRGQAALLMGCLQDAREFLGAASHLGTPAQRDRAAVLVAAVDSLVDGPAEDTDPRRRFVEQARRLVPAIATTADRKVMSAISEISGTWWIDPDEADAIQAASFLTSVSARQRWPWVFEPASLSPLFEAVMRVQNAGFQMQAGDLSGAVAVLTDVITRLPATHAAGGVMPAALRLLPQQGPEELSHLHQALTALGPANPIQYEIYGPDSGRRAAAAARTEFEPPTASRSDLTRLLNQLTPRERETIDLVLEGRSNLAIASRLVISERTVEVHLRNGFKKLNVRTRAELFSLVLRSESVGRS